MLCRMFFQDDAAAADDGKAAASSADQGAAMEVASNASAMSAEATPGVGNEDNSKGNIFAL